MSQRVPEQTRHEARDELQTLARGREYPRFRTWFAERVADLERLTATLGRSQQEQHGFYFRKQMRDFIESSELLARTNLDLYVGEPRLALSRVRKRWPALQRSLLPFRIQSLRILSLNLRARAALACAALGDPDRDGDRRAHA